MGFLDHSTNNIIVDAVLTDVGREKLANATASENFVASYAFADDEVDYTMIKKYGTIVGKEKIEKNTPIFEASTNAELGVKYFLQTSPNPNVAQASIATTITPNSMGVDVSNTSLTITLTDTESILSGLEYTITYDSNFLVPRGYQGKDVKGSKSRKYIIVENGSQEDVTIRFSKAAQGRKILDKMGKTEITTAITVSSTGTPSVKSHVTVKYQ